MYAVRFYWRLKKCVIIERIIHCERLYIVVKEISILNLPAYDISMIDCISVANIRCIRQHVSRVVMRSV